MAKKKSEVVEKKVALQIGQLQFWTKGASRYIVLEARKLTDEVEIQKVSGDSFVITRDDLRSQYSRVSE
jgi:hypothetical protein